LTHLGNFKKVTNKIEKEISEEIIIIELEDGKKIECTKEHKIFNGQDFIEANKLNIGDEVAICVEK